MISEKRNYCKVLDPADYVAWGISNRKAWEIRMAMDTLTDLGAVHENAEILGVGAGKESTIFQLSNQVKRVFATDLYMDSGAWSKHAPVKMLMNPSLESGGQEHNRRRIVVQHADMLDLPYEDNSFDGVFSSGSLGHVGSYEDVAQAAREIGRVLKPGGVASISTEWRLSGQGWGWDNVLLFDPETIVKYIVEPSGLYYEGISGPAIIDEEAYPFDLRLKGHCPPMETVLSHRGFTFTSVHIALVKKDGGLVKAGSPYLMSGGHADDVEFVPDEKPKRRRGK